jgi:hypothetical protein
MGKLITTSLLDQIDWFRVCPASWKESAYKGIHNTVNRIYEANPATQRGVAFENVINACLDMDEGQFVKQFDGHCADVVKFHQVCHGGRRQAVAKRHIEIDGEEYTLYGKMDVLFPPVVCPTPRIVDIKTTGNYRGKQSYLDKNQHLVYCFATRIPSFTYIVAEFTDISDKCVEVHQIDTEVDIEAAGVTIVRKIQEMVSLLQDDIDLWTAYLTKFNRYQN